ALKHAARELPREAARKPLEADLLEQRIGLVAKRRAPQLAELRSVRLDDLERQHDVLLDRQPWQHGRILERHADPKRLGRDLAAAENDDARGWLNQVRDQSQ